MAKNRDNRPDLSFEELQRRHELYKKRTSPAQKADDAPQQPLPQTQKARGPQPAKAQPAPAPVPPKDDVYAAPEPIDPDETAPDEDDEALYAGDENPNPFGSIITFLHGSKRFLQKTFRKDRHEQDYEEFDDPDDFPEEEEDPFAGESDPFSIAPDAAEDPQKQPAQDFAPRDEAAQKAPPEEIPQPRETQPADVEIEDIPPAQDIPADWSAPSQQIVSQRAQEEEFADYDAPDDGAGDYDAENYDDENYDADAAREDRAARYAKFLRLFIQRADEDDLPEHEDDDREDDLAENAAPRADDEAFDGPVSLFPDEDAARKDEGGAQMEDKQKLSAEMTEIMAEGLGERTLSRRERRELEKRREEAESFRQETAKEETSVPAAPLLDTVDEPTREFKPVQRERTIPEAPASLFDEDAEEKTEEKPLSRREQKKELRRQKKELRRQKKQARNARYDEDDYDDEDDYPDDEPVKAPAHKETRRGRHYDDYDDEDDFDDDYDDGYDDDYDDDYDAPRRSARHSAARRGRSRRDNYDEYEDYDDYDDYDDDDEDRPSFGHFLTGIFRTLLIIVIVLLVAVLGLNVLHITGKTTLVTSMYHSVRDWSPGLFDTLFPCISQEDIDAQNAEGSDASGTVQQPTVEPDLDLSTGTPQGDTGEQTDDTAALAPASPN